MTSAYQTLSNGTLVDYELDDATGKLTIRAGKTLQPSERPIILELERPAEFLTLINKVLALYGVATGIMVPEVAPLWPRAAQVRLATDKEQKAAIVFAARAAVKSGATHDCGEWLKDGVCELCDRHVE